MALPTFLIELGGPRTRASVGLGHLRADERTAVSPPLHPPRRRRSGGDVPCSSSLYSLLAVAALVRGTFAAYGATRRPQPRYRRTPSRQRVDGAQGADPTARTLPPTTSLSLAAEVNARATLRIDGDPSGNRYTRGLATSTIGQVFSSSSLELCSATVIESPSERVAVTAAHCVYWPAGHPEYNPMRLAQARRLGAAFFDAFVPGRLGNQFPYGKWPVEGAWVDPVWQHTADPRYDVAFLRLGTPDGLTPQRILGAEGVVFDSQPPRRSPFSATPPYLHSTAGACAAASPQPPLPIRGSAQSNCGAE